MRLLNSALVTAAAMPVLMLAGAAWAQVMLPGAVAVQSPGAVECKTEARSVCVAGGTAQLTGATGEVLVSKGAQFFAIKSGSVLAAGDRLLVKQGAATISLAPSCEVRLGAYFMATISKRGAMMCADQMSSDTGPTQQTNTADAGAQKIPANIPSAPVPVTITPAAPVVANEGWGAAPYLIGIAGLAGGVGAALASQKKGGDSTPAPLSP